MTRRETDADAAAEAMSALADRRRKEEDAHRVAMERRARRRVMLKAGDLNELRHQLREALALAELAGVTKEPRLRTRCINLAAGLKPLIKTIEEKIPEYATANERGSAA